MTNNKKNNLLAAIIVVLVLGNIASIALFWLARPTPPPVAQNRTPAMFLIKELGLDSLQQKQLETLRNAHRSAAEPLRASLAEQKRAFFALLQKPGTTDSNKIQAEKEVLAINEKLDLLAFDHFNSIRNICRAEQKEKFDKIIVEVAQMLGNPGGPRPRGDRPPPRGEGPGHPPPMQDDGPPPPAPNNN